MREAIQYLFFAVLCLLFFAVPIKAEETDEVRTLLKTNIDAVVILLHDKVIDKTDRNEQIIDIVTPLFDYRAMSKLSLGKRHWPSLSKEERATFSDLFIARLQKTFLDKLDIYSDEEVIYGEPQVKGKMVHVPSTLISKENRIGILYKFYRSREGWKIYDVEIEGVSIIQTYRSQFNGLLSEGTIDDLLEKLKTDDTFAIPAPDDERVRPG